MKLVAVQCVIVLLSRYVKYTSLDQCYPFNRSYSQTHVLLYMPVTPSHVAPPCTISHTVPRVQNFFFFLIRRLQLTLNTAGQHYSCMLILIKIIQRVSICYLPSIYCTYTLYDLLFVLLIIQVSNHCLTHSTQLRFNLGVRTHIQ